MLLREVRKEHDSNVMYAWNVILRKVHMERDFTLGTYGTRFYIMNAWNVILRTVRMKHDFT